MKKEKRKDRKMKNNNRKIMQQKMAIADSGEDHLQLVTTKETL